MRFMNGGEIQTGLEIGGGRRLYSADSSVSGFIFHRFLSLYLLVVDLGVLRGLQATLPTAMDRICVSLLLLGGANTC